jgi:hypothetical protein
MLLSVHFVAIAVAVVILAGWAARSVLARRRRDRDTALAQQWAVLEQQRAMTPGAGLIEIANVYQSADRGTKAVIVWLDTGRQQDAWFADSWPTPGIVALVRGSTGWGPHNNNPAVFSVQPGQIVTTLPPGAREAVARHWARAYGR